MWQRMIKLRVSAPKAIKSHGHLKRRQLNFPTSKRLHFFFLNLLSEISLCTTDDFRVASKCLAKAGTHVNHKRVERQTGTHDAISNQPACTACTYSNPSNSDIIFIATPQHLLRLRSETRHGAAAYH
jgi:hypothetical protein